MTDFARVPLDSPGLEATGPFFVVSSPTSPQLTRPTQSSQPQTDSGETEELLSDEVRTSRVVSGIRMSLPALQRSGSSFPLEPATIGVLSGELGSTLSRFPQRASSSSVATLSTATRDRASTFSAFSSTDTVVPLLPFQPSSTRKGHLSSTTQGSSVGSNRDSQSTKAGPDPAWLWTEDNKEDDDYLHNPDPLLDTAYDEASWTRLSFRGLVTVGTLVALITSLVGTFAGWPIWNYAINGGWHGPSYNRGAAFNGGQPINLFNASNGPVPGVPGRAWELVDPATPEGARTRRGSDGEDYHLVFSDEFNQDGRTFWPGDDPHWEAVDLHYWATTDYEWYDPDGVTTKGGNLEITMTQQPIHDLNFRSALLQSWNKMCFTGGYVEVNVSLPLDSNSQGLWPAMWTMGNLGRAGFGGSVDGMWPYSYDTCDVGTLPNQTRPDGTPTAARTSGSRDYGGELSYLVGQRASACTCKKDEKEHPGPNVGVGRGAPEIDINEAQISYPRAELNFPGTIGSASQSIQVAPMDAGYQWNNGTGGMEIFNPNITYQSNLFTGAISQESMSVITLTDTTSYDGNGYTTFGFEYDPGPDGRITWQARGAPSWQLNAAAMGPNTETEIGQRVVSEEPMYINFNLAISKSFQTPVWNQLRFPAVLRIDYVRVYQKGEPRIGCDPADHPTSEYINNHPELYANTNITTFAQSNYSTPGNSLTGC